MASIAQSEYEKLLVSDLKKLLTQHNVEFKGVTLKKDLIALAFKKQLPLIPSSAKTPPKTPPKTPSKGVPAKTEVPTKVKTPSRTPPRTKTEVPAKVTAKAKPPPKGKTPPRTKVQTKGKASVKPSIKPPAEVTVEASGTIPVHLVKYDYESIVNNQYDVARSMRRKVGSPIRKISVVEEQDRSIRDDFTLEKFILVHLKARIGIYNLEFEFVDPSYIIGPEDLKFVHCLKDVVEPSENTIAKYVIIGDRIKNKSLKELGITKIINYYYNVTVIKDGKHLDSYQMNIRVLAGLEKQAVDIEQSFNEKLKQLQAEYDKKRRKTSLGIEQTVRRLETHLKDLYGVAKPDDIKVMLNCHNAIQLEESRTPVDKIRLYDTWTKYLVHQNESPERLV